tara:strand:+ start:3497 stop:4024 length:528 start_codon:yes stop_codon:yes gene_type:complete
MNTTATMSPAKREQGAIDPDRLDAILSQLEDEHGVLLGLAHEHKEALTHADVHALQRITMRTSETLMRIAKIEQQRQAMIAKRDEPVDTLDQLLNRFGDDDRTRINERRTRMKELIQRVREEQEAVKHASEQLAMHMKGLMKQVSASLSHSGTYSRAGSVDAGRTQVVSGLDTVS